MKASLYSAPGEKYTTHIERCLEKLRIIFPLFLPTMKRVLSVDDKERLKDTLFKMLTYHDLGKLTKRWQERVGSGNKLPSHSALGAGYLWRILPEGMKEPVSFAVAIHHTDKGLLGENIERPDVQAIFEGVVKNDGRVEWHEGTDELSEALFPEAVKEMTVYELKEMARGLRLWSRGGSFLEQHKKRLQAMFCHHILKLCDISAAVERRKYQRDDDKDYYGGWLMVEGIKKFMDNVIKRNIGA